MIEIKNISKSYGKTVSIDDFSYSFDKSRVYGIVGAKNAGKSSLLKILAGCIAQNDGSVTINKLELKKYLRKNCLGYMPEDLAIDNGLTVEEYLNFSAEIKGAAKKKNTAKEADKNIDKDFDKDFDNEIAGNRLIKKLSDKEKKLVLFKQALIGNPEVIILDEPMKGLDIEHLDQIKKTINSVKTGKSIIISSSSLGEISRVCDEILIIANGKLIAHDTPDNLKNIYGDTEEIVISIVGKVDKATSLLRKIPEVKKAEGIGKDSDGHNRIRIVYVPERDINEIITSVLAEKKIVVAEIIKKEASFEDIEE